MTKRSIETKVAGVSFRRSSVERMIDAGPENVEVVLIPDPTNEHDPAAIRVEMRPRAQPGSERQGDFEHVGFIPRYNAEVIGPELNRLGAGVSASLIDAGRMAGLGDMPWLRLRVEWED